LAFFFLAENLSIFDNRWERLPSTSLFTDTFDHWSKVWHTALMDGLHRVTLLAVFAVPVAWILFYPPFDGVGDQLNTIEASVGVDAVRDTLMIDGDRQGVVAVFAHAEHQKRLGGDSSCVCCHHISMPEDRSTPCSRCHRDMVLASHLFEHSVHTVAVAEDRQFGGIYPSNQSCTECHADGQPEMAATAKRCYDCHREDMWLAGRPDSTADLAVACSFRDAMHGTCIGCHKERREVLAKPELAECSTCHRSLKARLPESQMLADAR